MQTIIGLLLFIIIVCLFLGIKKQEHFIQKFTGEIRDNAKFVDGIVKDWVPNITWYYRWADKFIEWERAKQGLPPLVPATPQVSVNVRANNNKYRLTGGFW
jgi:hypothetical protein